MENAREFHTKTFIFCLFNYTKTFSCVDNKSQIVLVKHVYTTYIMKNSVWTKKTIVEMDYGATNGSKLGKNHSKTLTI